MRAARRHPVHSRWGLPVFFLLLLLLPIPRGFSQSTPTPLNQEPPEPPPSKGLHLIEDYLPLKGGIRWTYNVAFDGQKRSKPVTVEILKMMIKNFRSYYLFNRFPFVTGAPMQIPILRYDRRSQRYYALENEKDVELYPEEGAHAVTFEAGENNSGQVDLHILRAEFPPASPRRPGDSTLPPTDEIVFKYGVGIISARITTQFGVETFSIAKVETNALAPETAAGGAAQPGATTGTEPPPKPEAENPYAPGGPRLELFDQVEPGKVILKLKVSNPYDKMIPLTFDNDQSFDFWILPEGTDQPLWRWSERRYFSQVKRSKALMPGESLEFTGEWRGLDSNHQPVPAGKYRVIGVVTTTHALKTSPIEFQYTPAPPQ